MKKRIEFYLRVVLHYVLLFLYHLCKRPEHARGAYTAGINTEVWERHIVQNLYKNNEFLQQSEDDSEYVNNLTVHLPQAGADPGVSKNRSFNGNPTTATTRTDTTVDYNIDEYTTDPIRIGNAEEVQLSYNKRESVLMASQAILRQNISDNALVQWAPSAATVSNILRTSGFANNDTTTAVGVAANVNSTATGNRNLFTVYDVRQAALLLNNQNVPLEERKMLISANMYDQLITDMIATKYRDFSMAFDPKNGVVGRLMGFDLYIRQSVLTYNNAGTPVVKAVGAAGAATDNDCALFWQKGHLRRAIGDVHFFETLNSAVYYGDVYSLLLRFGGSKTRTSEVGVGAIVQGAHA